MSFVVDQNVVAKKGGHLNTPSKDLPPSLGFGSSSSPGIDSSPVWQRGYNWKPSLAPSNGGQYAKSIMPPKIPSLVLFGNSKANDDTINDASFEFSRGLQDSLNELTDDMAIGTRLLPADFPHPVSDEITIENLESSPPISTRAVRPYLGSKKADGSPRLSMAVLAPQVAENIVPKSLVENFGKVESEEPASDSDSNQKISVSTLQRKRSQADLADVSIPAHSSKTESLDSYASSYKRRKTAVAQYDHPDIKDIDKTTTALQISTYSDSGTIPVYANVETETGLPLFSGKAFKKVCDLQSFKTQHALRSSSLEFADHEQCHYTTKGKRAFDFGINAGGSACINLNTPVESRPPIVEQLPPHFIEILNENSDSESEDESEPHEESLPSLLRTPPRFSTLGNYDAVTEFARTLGRSHHNGFMFSSPYDHESSDINEPMEPHLTTPQTPKMTERFDKSLFNLQMRTPPGAIFSTYDYQMGNFATGMTPFINRLQ